MRRLRHLRPPGRRRHHGARPARPPAPRPGSRRHRLLRRHPVPFRAPHGPRRRQLLPPRGDRPPARHVGDRPCALFDHRRDHPAQRAAAVRRARRRRLRGRPQRQPDQRPHAAPPARARRRPDAVDHRHRGDPASGRALEAQPLHRPLHRRAARARRRLRVRGAHQQEADRRPRSARHPAAGDRHARRPPDPRLGDLRARHHRRQIRARRRERRGRGVRRRGHALAQAVPADGAAAVHLRVHLFRAARIRSIGGRSVYDVRKTMGARACARGAGRRRRRRAGAGFRRAGRDRLRAGVGHPLRARHHPQPLCRPHLHRADPADPRSSACASSTAPTARWSTASASC